MKDLIQSVAKNVSEHLNIQPKGPIEDITDLHDYLHYECRMSNEDKGQIWFEMLCVLKESNGSAE